MRNGRRVAVLAIIVTALIVYVTQSDLAENDVALQPKNPVLGRLVSTVGARRPENSERPVDAAANGSDVGVECAKQSRPHNVPESVEELQAEMHGLAGKLSRSDDAEYLLAAALLGGFAAPGAPLELLDRASRIAPSNALVAWNRLKICRELDGASCNLDEVEEKALHVDGDNGAVWMEVAMLRLRDGRVTAAADAVRQAIAAPRFDNYFIDHAVVIERALVILGDRSYTERLFSGIGVAAASLVSYYRITTQCEDLAGDRGVWLELCDQLGARMLTDGNTLMDQAIGNTLRKIAAEQSGEKDRAKQATADYEAFRAHYQALIDGPEALALLENDEAVLLQYVDNFQTYGELEAQVRLNAEAERLLEDPDYDGCNFVSRWASQ